MSIKNVFSNKKFLITTAGILGVLFFGVFFYLFFVPSIRINGNETEKIRVFEEYIDKGAKASYMFKDVSKDIEISGDVDSTKIGEYKISYKYSKGIFSKVVYRNVEVIDDVSPTIELTGDMTATVCPTGKYVEQGYTADDNYDGIITDKVQISEEENKVIYTVSDSSNNKTTVSRELIRSDTKKPSIKLKGTSTVYVYIKSKYTESGVKVSDDCDAEKDLKVETTGTVNTSKVGTYKIKYTVTDKSGNSNSVSRSVVVYNKTSSNQPTGKKGVIYLTFDDGPSSSITPGILKILKKKGVKATFFVINHSSSLDYLIKQEYNEGHTVALHSYTHNYKTVYSSKGAYFNDLDKISNKVKKLTGVESKIIRFPGGSSNTVSRNYSKGIMTYLTSEVLKRGYRYFDWNVSSGDAGGSNNKTQVYNSVVNGLSKSRINVVLMHDFESNYKTLNALSDIIDYGFSHGYVFEAIDESTPMVRHGVNN